MKEQIFQNIQERYEKKNFKQKLALADTETYYQTIVIKKHWISTGVEKQISLTQQEPRYKIKGIKRFKVMCR